MKAKLEVTSWQLFLARDRLGIKPLYYMQLKDKFLFASEIKSLLQCNEVKREVNLNYIHDFLSFKHCTHTDKTPFKEIYKLRPGCTMTITSGSKDIDEYWDLDYTTVEPYNEIEAIKNIKKLLKESVEKRLMSDVPLGIFSIWRY